MPAHAVSYNPDPIFREVKEGVFVVFATETYICAMSADRPDIRIPFIKSGQTRI